MKKSMYANMGIAALISMALLVTSVRALTSGANGTHDPGRMVECNGKLYIWSTSGGGMVSTDGLVWSAGTRLQFGSWVDAFASSNQGMWAPDELYYNGQYWLFYSVCSTHGSGTKGSCGIGVWTTPTLDPAAPNYKLTDRGKVLSSQAEETISVFDPGPFVDADNNLWVIWGGGGWITRLNNTTGMVSSENTATPGIHLRSSGSGEANYIHYRAPYYYMFWNTGGCCNGITSTYTIHMARSKTLTGGYNYNDNKIFYGPGPHTTGGINGPGHIGIANICGTEVFTYHYYPTERSILGVNYLTWSSDGWPVAGGQITAPLKPCGGTVDVKPGRSAADKSAMQIHTLTNGISIQLPSLAPNNQLNVEIFSVAGKKIMSASVTPKNGKIDIFDKGLTTGMYYVSITDNTNRTNTKMLTNRILVAR